MSLARSRAGLALVYSTLESFCVTCRKQQWLSNAEVGFGQRIFLAKAGSCAELRQVSPGSHWVRAAHFRCL